MGGPRGHSIPDTTAHPLHLIDPDYSGYHRLEHVRPESVTPTGHQLQICVCGKGLAAHHNTPPSRTNLAAWSAFVPCDPAYITEETRS